jgi:hypothetical protein
MLQHTPKACSYLLILSSYHSGNTQAYQLSFNEGPGSLHLPSTQEGESCNRKS